MNQDINKEQKMNVTNKQLIANGAMMSTRYLTLHCTPIYTSVKSGTLENVYDADNIIEILESREVKYRSVIRYSLKTHNKMKLILKSIKSAVKRIERDIG